ncbi:MAG: hypothetical protein ACOCUY_02835 [Verrucomicrobiota bacterium]
MSNAQNSTRKIRKRPVQRRSAPRPAKKKSSPIGIVVGLVGWLICVGLIAFMVIIRLDTQKKLEKLDVEHKKDMDALKQSTSVRQEKIKERSDNLIAAIEKQQRKRRDLEAKIDAAEKIPPKLEEKREELKTQVAQLDRKVANLREEAGLTGESRSEVLARLRQAQTQRNQLKQEYIQKYYRMLDDYQKAIRKNSAEQSRGFFNSHRETPFAPAAAYDAAEKYRMDGKAEEALRLYKEIVDDYPDSYYSHKARARISMVENREPDWDQVAPAVLQLKPYKALDIIN